MIAGDKYKHRHNPAATCEVIRETSRGAQVTVTETRGRKAPKVTRMFFDAQDFSDRDSQRAIWQKEEQPPYLFFYKIEGGKKNIFWDIPAEYTQAEAVIMCNETHHRNGLIGRFYLENTRTGETVQIPTDK